MSFTVREETKDLLRKLQGYDDPEVAHKEADNVLCDFIRYLGYKDIVDEYDLIKKWHG